MNFERNKAPIESMKIGIKENAINLLHIWENYIGKTFHMLEEETINFLRSDHKIRNKEGSVVTYHPCIIKNGQRDFVRIEDLNNKWILYRGKYYYIEKI